MDRLILAALALLATSVVRGESLTYSIYTLHGGERVLLAADRRDHTFDDIEVVPDSDQSGCKGCSRRTLKLVDGFGIGVYVVPDIIYKGKMVGFGMWVDREGDADGFSWVWFAHEEGLIFNRGKMGGRIRVAFEPYGKLFRMTSIEFLDDIDFTYEEDITVGPPGERSHVLVVARGSVLKVAR